MSLSENLQRSGVSELEKVDVCSLLPCFDRGKVLVMASFSIGGWAGGYRRIGGKVARNKGQTVAWRRHDKGPKTEEKEEKVGCMNGYL